MKNKGKSQSIFQESFRCLFFFLLFCSLSLSLRLSKPLHLSLARIHTHTLILPPALARRFFINIILICAVNSLQVYVVLENDYSIHKYFNLDVFSVEKNATNEIYGRFFFILFLFDLVRNIQCERIVCAR